MTTDLLAMVYVALLCIGWSCVAVLAFCLDLQEDPAARLRTRRFFIGAVIAMVLWTIVTFWGNL